MGTMTLLAQSASTPTTTAMKFLNQTTRPVFKRLSEGALRQKMLKESLREKHDRAEGHTFQPELPGQRSFSASNTSAEEGPVHVRLYVQPKSADKEWRSEEIRKKKEKEMKACTFKPNTTKSFRRVSL